MAIAGNNSLLRGHSGKIGDLVTRQVNSKTVVQKASKRRTKKSKREEENHKDFQAASAFAKEATRDPMIKPYFVVLAEKKNLSSAYSAALSLKLGEIKSKNEQAFEMVGESAGAFTREGETSSSNAVVSAFQEAEHIFQLALASLPTIWQNIRASALTTLQQHVLKTIIREQVSEALGFLDRD